MDLRQQYAQEDKQPYSITAYHLTNSGQTSPLDEKSPPLRLYHLPMNIVRFLRTSYHPDYKQAWQRLVERGWERPKPAKSKDDGRGEEVGEIFLLNGGAITSTRTSFVCQRMPQFRAYISAAYSQTQHHGSRPAQRLQPTPGCRDGALDIYRPIFTRGDAHGQGTH